MNNELYKLNFEKLLKYPKNFKIEPIYKNEIKCKIFCIDCENRHLLKKSYLESMSHGCSTDDLEKIYGKITNSNINKKTVMIVLENPGDNTNYCIGKDIHYNNIEKNIKKHIPIYKYYWSEPLKKWPISISDIEKKENYTVEDYTINYYGPYFAYIINNYGLKNCYITNIIKCNIKNGNYNEYKATADNCIKNYFLNEINILKPEVIICMGRSKVKKLIDKFLKDNQYKCKILNIYHPASRIPRKKFISENEKVLNNYFNKKN